MAEIFAFEIDSCPSGLAGEVLGEIQGSRAAYVVFQQVFVLIQECRVFFCIKVLFFELFCILDKGFRNEFSTVAPEMTGSVWCCIWSV